jgi:hypothetical protein
MSFHSECPSCRRRALFAYDRKSHIGQLDKGLEEAAAKNWTVVNMEDDPKTIYPTESTEPK